MCVALPRIVRLSTSCLYHLPAAPTPALTAAAVVTVLRFIAMSGFGHSLKESA
jgi:hypothetical protein